MLSLEDGIGSLYHIFLYMKNFKKPNKKNLVLFR